MSINWEQKYKSLIEAKIPDIQGGVFSPDGEVLYCNNPKITEAFAAKSGIINAIEKGARIFFAVDINGQSYNLSSGEKNFDDVAQLHPMNDSTGGGVVGVPKGFMIVAYSPEVQNEEVFRSYYPLMQEVVAAIKTELPEE